MVDTRTAVVGAILLFIVGGIGGAVVVTEITREETVTTSVAPESTNTMHHTMDSMTTNLEGKTGDELDKAFLEDMIVHHEGAIEMAEMVSSSKHKELRNLSTAIIKAQTKEIDQMKKWRAEWYK